MRTNKVYRGPGTSNWAVPNFRFSDRASLSSAQRLGFIGFVEQNVSVQLTLLYAVGLGGDADAARIGQTERRATLLDAL